MMEEQTTKLYETTIRVDEHDKDLILRYIRDQKDNNCIAQEMPVDLILGATLASAVTAYFLEKENR